MVPMAKSRREGIYLETLFNFIQLNSISSPFQWNS